jgi:hypothetical protein
MAWGRLTWVLLVFLLSAPAFASSERILIRFDRPVITPADSLERSMLRGALYDNVTLTVEDDGTAYGDVKAPYGNPNVPKNPEYLEVPRQGVLSIDADLADGKLDGEWAYEETLPPMRYWKHPRVYKGGGKIYSTSEASKDGGTGVFEGTIAETSTVWVDDTMKAVKEQTIVTRIRAGWRVVPTTGCGNGNCEKERGEDRDTCCLDCGCLAEAELRCEYSPKAKRYMCEDFSDHGYLAETYNCPLLVGPLTALAAALAAGMLRLP